MFFQEWSWEEPENRAYVLLVTKAFHHLGNLSSSLLRYAALPRETVCTENFTPWTKLHPCGASVCPSLCAFPSSSLS